MEAKEYGNVGKKAIWFVKSLLCGYIVTGFLLLILALMLYKLGLSEQNVNAGIVLIYVISTFSAGFVLGKLAGKRKFLWVRISMKRQDIKQGKRQAYIKLAEHGICPVKH